MTSLVQTDIGQRGIRHILPANNPDSFHQAALALLPSRKTAILTGFSCLVDFDPHIETDGIAGALAIAKSLAIMGREVKILMDKHCEGVMQEVVKGYFKDCTEVAQDKVQLLCFTCGKGKMSEEEKK